VDKEDLEYLDRLEVMVAHHDLLVEEIQSMMPSREQLLDQSIPRPDIETIRDRLQESGVLRAYFLGYATSGAGSSYGLMLRFMRADRLFARDGGGNRELNQQSEDES